MLRAIWERIYETLLFFGVSSAAADEDADDDQDDQEDQDDSDEGDEGEQDEDDSEDDSDENEDEGEEADEENDEEGETPKPKMYPESTVKRLRRENKNKRQTNIVHKNKIKALEAENRDLKKGRTTAEKDKKSAANSRLDAEIAEQKEAIADLTRERDDLTEMHLLRNRTQTISKVAGEVGFANGSDAVAFLSTRSDDFTDSEGEIDVDALQSMLEELLEEKSYLARQTVQDENVRKKKGRKEASKLGNPPEEQKIHAQDTKKGASKSAEETSKKIRKHLNNYDGNAAFKVWWNDKYAPGTQKDTYSVS